MNIQDIFSDIKNVTLYSPVLSVGKDRESDAGERILGAESQGKGTDQIDKRGNKQMKLYHTSQHEIQVPDIYYGRKNADFGQGFYLTPDKEFAYRWAWENSVINEYELDMTGLDVQSFSRDTDWVNYIFQNRRAKDILNVDIVVGPIANDTIFDSLGIISSGYLKPEEALKLLLIGPAYTQVALKSERAASCLHWIRAEKISAPEKDRKEQEEYQKMFAEALSTMGDLE